MDVDPESKKNKKQNAPLFDYEAEYKRLEQVRINGPSHQEPPPQPEPPHPHINPHDLHEARGRSDPQSDLIDNLSSLRGATQVKIQEELEEADGDHDKLHLWGRLRNEGVCKCGACDKRRHFTALRR
jgi:hypothetical protein